MSGTSSPHSGLTRRSFLKATGAAAGALGLAGAAGMVTADNWLAPTQAHAEAGERVAHLCHQFHCLTGCNLKCTIRDERVALIEPSDLVDESHSTICLRGINEVAHIYSSDRLQTPLRRVGERGEGKFEQISWDEAIKPSSMPSTNRTRSTDPTRCSSASPPKHPSASTSSARC